MKIQIGYQELVRRAEAEIKTISATEAITAANDTDTIFIDLRDIRELQREGQIPGARHVPRGLLEFWIDPQSPYHKPFFSETKRFIFYCNLGWRSALAARTAQMMGLENLCHIAGGFAAWEQAGGAVETKEKKQNTE